MILLPYFLLKKVASIDLKDQNEQTILHKYNLFDNLNFLSLLLKRNKKLLNIKDKYGKTPLHYAIYYDRPEIVSLFIKNGASVHSKDKNGRTLLHYSIKRNRRISKLLIKNGASPQEKDQNGESPISIAKDKGYKNLLKVLEMDPKSEIEFFKEEKLNQEHPKFLECFLNFKKINKFCTKNPSENFK